MALRIVNAPVIVCTRCRHSMAVCSCDSGALESLPAQFPEFAIVTDWRQISLDNRDNRIKLVTALRTEYQAKTESLMRQREDDMLRIIEESARPPRSNMTGKFASLTTELFVAMSKLPKGKALVYEFDKPQLDELKRDKVTNPVKAVVNAVRRKIKANELPFDCYGNDETSFTVMREAIEKK